VVSSTTATSHSVTLPGLDPATVYHFQITATYTSGKSVVTPDATFTTLATSASALMSDDFNACGVDGSVWAFVDPVGDGSVSVNGTQLELSVPAGLAHDVWTGGNMAPRLMQPVNDGDFEAEVKFESAVMDSYEMQGLIVQQDLDDFLRFDFYGDGTRTRVFAARFVAGVPTALVNVTIPASSAPLFLKVTRTGDTWVLAYSGDGSTWTSVTSFVHVLSVSEVGPFVGNAGSSPPGHTAVIDYVFDTSAPIVPEDSDALSCVKLSELAANLGTAVGGAIQVR
jgi:regulation of enolase protein 1 (concanavalin A-like superfamily)